MLDGFHTTKFFWNEKAIFQKDAWNISFHTTKFFWNVGTDLTKIAVIGGFHTTKFFWNPVSFGKIGTQTLLFPHY